MDLSSLGSLKGIGGGGGAGGLGGGHGGGHGQAGGGGQISAKELQDSLKLINSFSNLMKKAKNKDTEGAKDAWANIAGDLVRLNPNATNEDSLQIKKLVKEQLNEDHNATDFQNHTDILTDMLQKHTGTFLKDNDNSTDSSISNSTSRWGSWGSHRNRTLPDLDDMSTGLDLSDLSELLDTREPGDLNESYTHSIPLIIASSLIMVSFFYYIPRMVYFRLAHVQKDCKHAWFFPILYLSAIACVGAVVHMASAFYKLTHNEATEMWDTLIFGQPNAEIIEPDHFTPFVLKAFCASVNRIIGPIIALVCLQQVGLCNPNFNVFQNIFFQLFYCALMTGLTFGYTFFKFHDFLMVVHKDNVVDPIHLDIYDAAAPFVTAVIFFYARQAVNRQSTYEADRTGPNAPNTLDRISKVVIFQVIMAGVAVFASFMSFSEDEELNFDPRKSNDTYYFFITAQTPIPIFFLFKSLLRSRKSKRICFLVCCSSGDQVGSAENVDMNGHPKTNEPSEKHEDHEDEENGKENTAETLDHNKIHIS